MKTVIRRGVFETNSSSSHSLTYKKVRRGDKNEVEKDASFEIRSPFAKALQLVGLIDNAEREYLSEAMMVDDEPENEKIKKAVIEKIKEIAPEALLGVVTEGISSVELAMLIKPLLPLADVDEEFFQNLGPAQWMLFVTDNAYRDASLRFREAVLDELSEMLGKSRAQIREEFEIEAFSNGYIIEMLEDKSMANVKLREMMEWNYDFKFKFEKSGEKDLIAFAERYVREEREENKKRCDGKISCDLYFGNGCLNECDCGCGNYLEITKTFEIDADMTDDEMRAAAKRFLSPEYKIVARELYCGLIFERSGEIY